jgi:hypothetical protein
MLEEAVAMRAHARDWVLGSAAVAALVAACGTSNGGGATGAQAGPGTTAGVSPYDAGTTAPANEAGGSSTGVSSGQNGSFGVVPDASASFSGPTDGGPDSFVSCAMETQKATLLPLDLYFILDTSSSMDDLVAPQTSKWTAVKGAITTFVNDPASAGLGMGSQYFPGMAAGAPASCTTNAQCGASGPCLLNFCADGTGFITVCNTNRDCGSRILCIPAGFCQNDHNVICSPPLSPDCGTDMNGFPLGTCLPATPSYCINTDDCVAKDYSTPAVGVAALPGIAPMVIASLGTHHPGGNTPTQPALQGAIDGARAYAVAHPGHTVVVVLATDGQPDETANAMGQCMAPTTLAQAQAIAPQVANVARNGVMGPPGTPSIKTFGIGVFTPNDVTGGTAALNQIASAGGTNQPFIIATATAKGNLEQDFTAALNSIRGSSLPCNYQLPVPSTGKADFNKVNVQYTSGSGTVTTEPYVEFAASCDPKYGGWYYDQDPAEGGTPMAIDTCPATCATLKGDPNGGRVDIVLGCQTSRTIPR